MDSMVEKVADAIVQADDEAVEDEMEPTSQRWAQYIARAAINAMMEPTFEIIQAGMNTKDNGDGQLHRRKWRAMIQAALADAGEKQG